MMAAQPQENEKEQPLTLGRERFELCEFLRGVVLSVGSSRSSQSAESDFRAPRVLRIKYMSA